MDALTTTKQASIITTLGQDLTTALGDFLRLKVADGDASKLTIQNYHSQINLFVEWCNENGINPARATEDDIIAYRRYLVETGYNPATINVKLAAIRKIYDAACWRGLRSDNPASGIKAPRDETAQEDKIKFLPLDGLRRLLALPNTASDEGIRDRAILALMAYHGLRVAEVASLTLDRLDFEQNIITVTGKRGKTRKIYLTDATRAILSGFLAVRGKYAREDEDRLFVALGNKSRGKGLTTRGIRYLTDSYLEQVGLKREGISCHSLRHSFATWSLAGGAKEQSLQGALGHSSGDMTRHYAKIVDRMTENPTKYLEAMLA